MFQHFLDLWIALPCSAGATITGAFLWYSASRVRTATGGPSIIDVPSRVSVRLRQSVVLTGVGMAAVLGLGWLLAQFMPFPFGN